MRGTLVRLRANSCRIDLEKAGALAGNCFNRIAIPEAEIAKLDSLKLVAGMPAEAFIQIGDRTALSYIMRPLHDQIARAFKEK